MAHPARFEGSNAYPTHLTWGTRWRAPYFQDPEIGKQCLKAIENERRRMGVDVLAYCLMPDHFHLVVAPTPMSLSEVVRCLKLASVHRLKADEVLPGGIWKRSFWDRGIETEKQLHSAIDYVHNNPVKAGLAVQAEAYLLSSSAGWSDTGPSIIRLAKTPEFAISRVL